MKYKNITVAGSGVLGSQIAFQTAYKGFSVTVYDINEEALDKAKDRILKLKPLYEKDLGASAKELDDAYARMEFNSNLEEAVRDADLVIEAIPEVLEIKKDFYTKLGKLAPAKAIFATNSSTLLPSQFADATDRPEQFLALHFANQIWTNNTAEIMRHSGTDLKVFNDIVDFAKAIGMVPIKVNKEQPGYVLNSLLVPFLKAAQLLLVKEVADPETIDKTWMIATGAPLGPFAIMDIIGLNTQYNIAKTQAIEEDCPDLAKLVALFKTEYIDKGKMGRATGEGFYKYPNPRFEDPDFLKE